jgi:hypothetical protein
MHPEYQELPAAAWDQFLGTGLQQAGLEIESLELHQVPFKELSACSQSALCQLKTLQKLVLSKCSMDPAVLSVLTQLTYLKLASVDVSTGYNGRDYAYGFEGCDDTEGVLLDMLSSLTQLRHLELSRIYKSSTDGEDDPDCYDPDWGCTYGATAWPHASPALTALFASSQLQHLELDDPRLPAGALQHALAGVQQLPHLTVLRLGSAGGDALDSTSIAALASRMPALQSCSIRIAAGAQPAALGQLPALRTLEAHVYNSSTLAEVATALTRLDALSIHCHNDTSRYDALNIHCYNHDASSPVAAAGISSEHLAALTALRQLRTLRFEADNWHVPLTGSRWSDGWYERHITLNLQGQVRSLVTFSPPVCPDG